MSICPKGYYWNGKYCKKSITIKHKGIYGKGFLSEPRSEQEAKIRKESRIEGSVEAEKQMAALLMHFLTTKDPLIRIWSMQRKLQENLERKKDHKNMRT